MRGLLQRDRAERRQVVLALVVRERGGLQAVEARAVRRRAAEAHDGRGLARVRVTVGVGVGVRVRVRVKGWD